VPNSGRRLCDAAVRHEYIYREQHISLFPPDSSCLGGQGTEPNEQNTQQSPLFGFSFSPQPTHT